MPQEVKPNGPLNNAEGGTEVPEPAPGPKASGTFKKEVQPLNAEPENQDQNAGSGTVTKPQGTLSKQVKPEGRG